MDTPRAGATATLPVIPFRLTRVSENGRKGNVGRNGAAQKVVALSATRVKQCRQLVLKTFGILYY